MSLTRNATGQVVAGEGAAAGARGRRLARSRRVRLRLALVVVGALLLFLALAAPVLADGLNLTIDNWHKYTSYQDPAGVVGRMVDRDPGVWGVQIEVYLSKPLKLNTLPILFHYLCPYDDTWKVERFLPTPYPQPGIPCLVEIDAAGNNRPPGNVHVYVNQDNWEVEAGVALRTGYWEFVYQDGTSAEVDCYTTISNSAFAPEVGDPINAASGIATASATDLLVPGRGLPLVFFRSYTSAGATAPGPLGHGWTHAYASHLDFPSAGLVFVTYPDGRRHDFVTLDAGATYSAPPETFETLARLPDASYTLTFRDLTTYHYLADGRLGSLTDRYGNETTLTYQGDTLTQVQAPSGRSLEFTYQGERLTLLEARASGVTVQSVAFTYDAAGDLRSVTDAAGHATTYTYDASHRLVSEREPRATQDPARSPLFTNTYAAGRVTGQSDALGHGLSLDYDQAAQESTLTNNRGHSTTYATDDSYRLTALTDPLGALTSLAYGPNGLPHRLTDARGGVRSYEYDLRGNLTALHDPQGHVLRAGFDEQNNLLWVQDPLGERLSRTTSGLLLRDDFTTNSLASYTAAGESGSPAWSIASGLLSQTLRYATASLRRDGVSDVTCASAYLTPKFGSEAVVDLLVATGAKDSTSKAFLGYSARLSTTTASLEKRTQGAWNQLAAQSYATPYGTYRQVRLYVEAGVVHMRAGAADLSEVALAAADATYTSGSGGVRAKSRCDYSFLELRTSHRITVTGLPAGYLVRLTQGTDTAQAFASAGSAVIDAGALLFPLDRIEVFDTSAMKVAELTTLDLADMGGGDVFAYDGSAGHRTTFAYDATGTYLHSITTPVGTTSFTSNLDGTLAALTDARSNTWSYGYNTFGDLTSITDPLSYVTTYTRDPLGRVTAIEDANSSRTEYEYDPVGQLVTIKTALAQLDPLNRHQIDITYDANGNQTLITDPNGNETEFTYDDMNLLVGATDALGGEATYGYDAAYNLTSVEDPRGYTTTHAYDACNRLQSVTDPLSRTTTFDYDLVGRLTGVSYARGNAIGNTYTPNGLLAGRSYTGDSTTWAFSYDPTGALTQAQRNDARTWSYTYDAGGRLQTASDQNNSALGLFTFTFGYDTVSNLTSLAPGPLSPFTYAYNARNELTSFSGPGGVTTFSHDPGGRLTQVATPDGSTRSFTYDARSSLSAVTNVTGSGTQVFTYTRDANGNTLSENSSTYTYDALNRLTSWYDPVADVTTTYTYDAAGNLTGVEEDGLPTESYAFNAANEITNSGFTYDLNGNLTSDGAHTYTYDAEDRLVEVSDALGTLATMTYDFADRRTSLSTASGTIYFHYDGSRLVAESNSTGTLTATYVWAEGGLVSMTRGASTYFYQTNGHGDVVSLTDASGQVVNSYSYDPWGAPLTVSETVPNPFRYASYYYDTDTGLYYLWHRYYDPGLKRFLTLDPVGGLVARPTSFNLYLYCYDNPLGYTDPSGLIVDVIVDVGFAAYDLYELATGGWKNIGTNLAALGADLGCAIIPGATGGGMMVRAGSKIDNAVDAGRAASRAGGKVDEAVDGGRSLDDLLDEAAQRYPSKAGKTENHHVVPKYLGGDSVGPTAGIDAAYHQMITSAFRKAWPYGQRMPNSAELRRILEDVYSQYPLP